MSFVQRSGKKPRRLSRRLAIRLILLALIQLLAGGIPLLLISYFNQQKAIQLAQIQATQRAALSIDAYLKSATDRMQAYVQDHDKGVMLQGRLSSRALEETWDLLSWGGFLEVWILDREGNEILQSSYKRFVNPEQYASRANRPEYTALLEGRSSYIGPVHISPEPVFSMLPVSTISVPILISGEVRGVLVAELDTRRIQDVISELTLGAQSYAYVVDREGILRVHWSDTRVALEERNLSYVPAVQAFLEGRTQEPNYRGINEDVRGPVLGTWAALEEADWGVIVEQPAVEAFGNLRRLTFWLVGLLVVSLAAAGGLGTLWSRQLLRPLEVLQEGARQLGRGNLSHRIELNTQDEFTDLARTFNEMAEQLERSHDSIEAEVQERTQELSAAYEQLQQQSSEQGRLLEMIRQMSVPVVPVLKGVVVMPLVGSIDSERADLVTEALLAGVEEHGARVVILDITGLPVVDTAVANALLKAMQAATLLGVQSVLVGIRPEVAQTVVHLGVDLSQIVTRSTLQAGVEYAMQLLGRREVNPGAQGQYRSNKPL